MGYTIVFTLIRMKCDWLKKWSLILDWYTPPCPMTPITPFLIQIFTGGYWSQWLVTVLHNHTNRKKAKKHIIRPVQSTAFYFCWSLFVISCFLFISCFFQCPNTWCLKLVIVMPHWNRCQRRSSSLYWRFSRLFLVTGVTEMKLSAILSLFPILLSLV